MITPFSDIQNNDTNYTAVGEFSWIRQPENLTVAAGSDVYLPCEYSGVNVQPFWRCNEEIFYSLDLPPGQGYTFNNSGLIIANVQLPMNMTHLQCSCFLDLFDGPKESTIGYMHHSNFDNG